MEGERKPYLTKGYYIEMPIVLQVLLSPVELMVLNTLIHLTDLKKRFISQSLIAAYTGRDEKSIRAALRFMERHLKIIEKDEKTKCQLGTHYEIRVPRLTQLVDTLTKEKNPVERMKIADRLRGAEHAIHTSAIKNLTNTFIDTN